MRLLAPFLLASAALLSSSACAQSDQQLLASAPDGVKVMPNLVYREGHERWKLDLAMPKAKAEKPRPAMVFVHGGGWRNGDKRRGLFLSEALEYASRGYVAITVNYRLVDSGPFPACVEDVKTAVRWLRAHAEEYQVDPDRIGAFGNSAGGHLVLMLGLVGKDAGLEGDGPWQEFSSQVNAVCAGAPPTDIPGWPGDLSRWGREGGLLAGPADSLEERAKQASPISYVSSDMVPVLLIHGTRDGTVPVEQSTSFEEAAKEAGAQEVSSLIIEGAGHGVVTQHRKETLPAMQAFFERTLGVP